MTKSEDAIIGAQVEKENNLFFLYLFSLFIFIYIFPNVRSFVTICTLNINVSNYFLAHLYQQDFNIDCIRYAIFLLFFLSLYIFSLFYILSYFFRYLTFTLNFY